MEYLFTGKAAKSVDEFCIGEIGIPALSLMERAAYAVASNIDQTVKGEKLFDGRQFQIVAVCGIGNNGADGIAAVRMLKEMGYLCKICIVGDIRKATEEFHIQYEIAKKLNIDVKVCDTKAKVDGFQFTNNEMNTDVLVIDALFGIGLSRDVEGFYYGMIKKMNELNAFVAAVDIASGLNSATGKVMRIAVNADMTVTFGKMKAGHILCDGRNYSGKVMIEDVGFVKKSYNHVLDELKEDVFVYLTVEDLKRIPARKKTSHKGMYHTVHVIGAGIGMSGAAALSGMAAYRCGAGLVKIYAEKSNTEVIRTLIKEAVVNDYSTFDINNVKENDIIVAGPGLGTSDETKILLEKVLKTDCKIVIDADALNLLSMNKILLKQFNENIVITPHLKEMSRLIEKDVSYIRENIIVCARDFSVKYGCTTVIKDATTVISSPQGNIRINTAGNSGMSKGGSGDVLSGIIGGLISQNMSVFEAASIGVYLHGMAGDLAAEAKSEYSMTASDIVEMIPEVMKLKK